ncbi:MAG: hypothetical protein M1816_002088 [Peltula sp. TS41687]|nr:MAG: hypothetical protein M1816_002088 [Peltula sp. TS41687]
MDLSKLPPGVPLSSIPMAVNPDGSPPNFIDPPSLSAGVTAVGILFAALATITVALRSATNLRTARGFRLDDALAFAALVLAHIITGVFISLGYSQRHMWDLPVSLIDEAYVKKTFVVGFIYGPGIWCAKVSILVLLHGVFAPKVWFRASIYIGIVLVTLVHWSNVPVYVALCTPRAGESWDLALLQGRCGHSATHTLVAGTLGTAIDIYILILPLPIIFGLNLPFKRRVGLALIFLVGIIAIAASAIALYYRVVMFHGQDISWNGAKAVICVFVETYLGIMVGCAPALVSIWRNQISKSEFYSNIRTLLSSGTTSARQSKQLYPVDSLESPQMRPDGAYELIAGKRHEVRSYAEPPTPGMQQLVMNKEVIVKSLSVNVTSESKVTTKL